METMFYDEPTLLTTARKPPMGLDNSSLKLNLCTDGKNLDIAARRDELGFDLADFLISPDIGISSPDLENLVWKEWNSALKTPGSLPEQQNIKQEHCEDKGVTKEQEVFAFGFTEALKKLQETEKQEIQEINHEETTGDSSECSDSGSHEDSSFEPENCDAKITFISYTFDSKERLPSFQEAFAKIIIKKSKESEICFQIKTEASENEPLVEHERSDHCSDEDKESQKWNNNCSGKDVWDRVETVDEGFCSREAMAVDLEQHSYLEVPGISSECGINQSMSWEHSNDFNLNNSHFFREKATAEQQLLSDFNTDQYSDENYIENMGRIADIDNIGNDNHGNI